MQMLQIHKLLAKYRAETIDIEDIDYEEADLEETIYFPSNEDPPIGETPRL